MNNVTVEHNFDILANQTILSETRFRIVYNATENKRQKRLTYAA